MKKLFLGLVCVACLFAVTDEEQEMLNNLDRNTAELKRNMEAFEYYMDCINKEEKENKDFKECVYNDEIIINLRRIITENEGFGQAIEADLDNKVRSNVTMYLMNTSKRVYSKCTEKLNIKKQCEAKAKKKFNIE